MFKFFLESYRKGILTFCGSDVIIDFDINEVEGKRCFRNFDNGQYKLNPIVSKHPNIVRSVIIGKKSWGLFIQEWTKGIVDCDFTIEEIIYEFEILNIIIPEPLLLDFKNKIKKGKINKYTIDLSKSQYIY